MAANSAIRVVIFCRVIDNFGDIGVCWRLARQLAVEKHWQVVLLVDDLASFARICPALVPTQSIQQLDGIDILHWEDKGFTQAQWQHLFTLPINLCIEAFACDIPLVFLQHLQQSNPLALWLNLEYLTAESWAGDCHLLPSPQQGLSLKKYFFFPGFLAVTGGLLRESTVIAQAQLLQQDPQRQQEQWRRFGITPPIANSFVISLFAYSQRHIMPWLAQLTVAAQPVMLLVAEGALAQSLREQLLLSGNHIWQQGQLTVQFIPFLMQQDYDALLAMCDLNFVRGEDSVIRAHWAQRPFIWQIYRQAEGAHLEKLAAFLDLMLAEAPPALADLWRRVHLAWEEESAFAAVWPEILAQWPEIARLHTIWLDKILCQQDLATNLVRFVEKQLILPRNFS